MGDAGFDPDVVAAFTEQDVEALMGNARIFCEMRDRGEDFAGFAWSFTNGEVLRGDGRSVPTETELSRAISKEMKRRGFTFVGPTIVYAWMQAVGIVDDHALACFRRSGRRSG